MNDIFNYYNAMWQNGHIVNFNWNPHPQNSPHPNHHQSPDQDESQRPTVLWIDNKNDDNMNVVQQVTQNQNIKFDFCESLAEAQNYLTKNFPQILIIIL